LAKANGKYLRDCYTVLVKAASFPGFLQTTLPGFVPNKTYRYTFLLLWAEV